MMTIWAECWVHASHDFNGHQQHGHSYLVRVSVLVSPDTFLNAEHLFAHLKEVAKGIDHRSLNEVLSAPSMESMASWFAIEMSRTYAVTEVSVTRPEGLGCKYVCPVMEKT